MLVREATVRDIVPEYKENRRAKAFQVTFAESCGEDALSVIRAFHDCVFAGVTPPPNLLTYIAEKFGAYLDSKQISLDYAFGLQPKPGVGHPLSHREKSAIRRKVLYEMWRLRSVAKTVGNRLSVSEAAKRAIKTLNLSDEGGNTADALAKDYARKNVDEILDMLANAESDLGEQFANMGKTAEGKELLRALEKFLTYKPGDMS